jgi:hypothetical protein
MWRNSLGTLEPLIGWLDRIEQGKVLQQREAERVLAVDVEGVLSKPTQNSSCISSMRSHLNILTLFQVHTSQRPIPG